MFTVRLAFPALCFAVGIAARGDDLEVVRYHLPRTDVSAQLSLTLERCDTRPHVSGEVTIVAVGGAGDGSFAPTAAPLQ